MIKGKIYFLLFFGILATLHYGLAIAFPKPYFNKTLVLAYTVLVLVSFIGNALIHIGIKQQEASGVSSMFLIFTTIQMLIALSFSAYIIYGDYQFPKEIVLQFIALFFFTLIIQTIYFVRLINRDNQQKNT